VPPRDAPDPPQARGAPARGSPPVPTGRPWASGQVSSVRFTNYEDGSRTSREIASHASVPQGLRRAPGRGEGARAMPTDSSATIPTTQFWIGGHAEYDRVIS